MYDPLIKIEQGEDVSKYVRASSIQIVEQQRRNATVFAKVKGFSSFEIYENVTNTIEIVSRINEIEINNSLETYAKEKGL